MTWLLPIWCSLWPKVTWPVDNLQTIQPVGGTHITGNSCACQNCGQPSLDLVYVEPVDAYLCPECELKLENYFTAVEV
jgi:hypothetical protein